MTRVSKEAKKVLEKISAMTGRDNRTPFVGNTQFPTEGSKSFAEKLDRESKSKAEKGPAPLMGDLRKNTMVTLDQVSTKMPSPIGSLPKIGSARYQQFTFAPGMATPKNVQKIRQMMEAQATYPGVRDFTMRGGSYRPTASLAKQGEAMADFSYQDDPLVQYLKKEAEQLKNNVEDLDLGEKEEQLQAKDSDFVGTQAEKKRKEEDELLKKLFANYPTEQPKVVG